jgi:PadR family transcriptional regulator, regulatory protein PadR
MILFCRKFYFTYIYILNQKIALLLGFNLIIKIMKGTNIGEFEELVMLTIAALMEDAYSVSICDELTKRTGRSIKLGVIHAVLHRLEQKEFVISNLGEATNIRGGKRKRFYILTTPGKHSLIKAKELRDELWSLIPNMQIYQGI